ncbi:MAG: hypothetical protein ACREXU_06525 [Gammaproteobacteria bacterium]
MLKQFKKLGLKGAYVRDVTLSLNRKLLLSFMVPPDSGNETTRKFTKSYDVQFNKIADFEINVSASPWLEVLSHDALASSPLIDRVEAREKKNHPDEKLTHRPLYHFKIVFDEGKLEVVAETCTVSLVEELPAFSNDSFKPA